MSGKFTICLDNSLYLQKTSLNWFYCVWKRLDLPRKSASTDKAPMQSPPNAAAVGMYLFSSWIMDASRWPRIIICCSLSCLATYYETPSNTSNLHKASRKTNSVWFSYFAELHYNLLSLWWVRSYYRKQLTTTFSTKNNSYFRLLKIVKTHLAITF